jgi:tetratricopeptide (TPR) repeat protein
MPIKTNILILTSFFVLLFMSLPSTAANSFYTVYDNNITPSGMIPYEAGWQHGSLFSAPNWLLAMYDSDDWSHALDYGYTPKPTTVPKDIESYISAGYSSIEGGNYRDAYNSFLKATELDPSSSDAWYGLGLSLEKQMRYVSALDAYGKAISQEESVPDNWKYYAGRGRVAYTLNRFNEAVNDLTIAISNYGTIQASDPDALEEMKRLLEDAKAKSGMQYGGIL